MNKYNHGTTILEVLVSISLISIIVGLLFGLLIEIQKDDEENNIKSSFILAQSTIVKAVEEDAINYTIKAISSCTLDDAGVDPNTVYDSANYECVRIEYDKKSTENNIGYITIYNYYKTYGKAYCPNNENKCNPVWVARYTRGKYEDCLIDEPAEGKRYLPVKTQMREMLSDVYLGQVKVTYNTKFDASRTDSNQYANPLSIVLPITSSNGFHYDIVISSNHKLSNTTGYKNFICDITSPNLCSCVGDNCNMSSPSGDKLDENGKYIFTC